MCVLACLRGSDQENVVFLRACRKEREGKENRRLVLQVGATLLTGSAAGRDIGRIQRPFRPAENAAQTCRLVPFSLGRICP